MNSIGKDCNELKRQYEECFNVWFADKFLRGEHKEESCALMFRLYQNCVKKAINEQKIELWEIEKNVLGTDNEAKQPPKKDDHKKSK